MGISAHAVAPRVGPQATPFLSFVTFVTNTYHLLTPASEYQLVTHTLAGVLTQAGPHSFASSRALAN